MAWFLFVLPAMAILLGKAHREVGISRKSCMGIYYVLAAALCAGCWYMPGIHFVVAYGLVIGAPAMDLSTHLSVQLFESKVKWMFWKVPGLLYLTVHLFLCSSLAVIIWTLYR